MRKMLLYIHLSACLVAGVVIALLCFSGILIAFKPQIIAFSERGDASDAMTDVSAGHIGLAELVTRTDLAMSGNIRTIELENRAGAEILFTGGKDLVAYVNPWSGAVRRPESNRMREFMQTMTDLHRWLGLRGEYRSTGKMINGIGNAVLLVLVVSGVYLWWPRTWSKKQLQAITVLNLGLKGRAGQYNLHNSIGLWTAPILLVITLTALPISFQFVDRLVSLAAGGDTARKEKSVRLLQPLAEEDFRSGAVDRMIAEITRDQPGWKKIVIKRTAMASNRQRPAMLEIAVHDGGWLRKPPLTMVVDGISGSVLKKEGPAELPLARKLRFWERTLHNGTALGWFGQMAVVAGACGGLVLLWSGMLLSIRRFKNGFGGKTVVSDTAKTTG